MVGAVRGPLLGQNYLMKLGGSSLMSNFGTKFHFEVEKVKKCLKCKYKNIYSV